MPFSLTRRGWGFVLGAVVLGLAGPVIELRDFWYLPAFLAAVPVVAILTVLLIRVTSRLDVRVTAADPTPSLSSTVDLAAVLTHRLPIGLSTRVIWALGEAAATTDVYLARGTPHRISQQWFADRRGPAIVGVQRVLIVDPLGVAAVKMRTDGRALLAEALVLPRLLDAVPELREPRFEGDAPTQSNTDVEQGTDIPMGALRKYRPGDALRTVDWKQTARQRELLVRIAESDNAQVRQITIVTEFAAYRSDEEFEFAISQAATVAVAWLRGGNVVELVVDREHTLTFSGESDLLRRLAYLSLGTDLHAAK